jgi:energy-converting hydrogenase Eha subunit C
MQYKGKLEYAQERKMREWNTPLYRLAHWPIWVWVFFLAPGPLTFSLFAHGFGRGNLVWLIAVLVGTGIAGLRGRMPGVEPRPYILRFDEDRPNPLYRRVCYTFAWNAVISFALLNLVGLVIAVVASGWYIKQIYQYAYAPLCAVILLLGATGLLPRVGPSTKGEGLERRYFYGSVWAVTAAQIVLLILWKTIPLNRTTSLVKLVVYVGVLGLMGIAASRGLLLRTRPIVPGELMVAD